MHYQVGVGQTLMNFFNAADGQNFTSGLTGELVGTVASTDGNGQGVYLGSFYKLNGLIGVSQQLIFAEGALKTVAVLCFTLTGL